MVSLSCVLSQFAIRFPKTNKMTFFICTGFDDIFSDTFQNIMRKNLRYPIFLRNFFRFFFIFSLESAERIRKKFHQNRSKQFFFANAFFSKYLFCRSLFMLLESGYWLTESVNQQARYFFSQYFHVSDFLCQKYTIFHFRDRIIPKLSK